MNTPVFRTAVAVTSGLLAWAAGYWFFPAPASDTALGEQMIAAYDINLPSSDNTPSALTIDGRTLYVNTCQSCHQPSGQGLGKVFPPLAATDWVTGDAYRLALVVLQGMTGQMQVNDQQYNSVMPGFKTQLSDEQLVAVLNFIRTSWGNHASAVPIDVVRQARQAVSSRVDPWRGEQELLAFLADSRQPAREVQP